MSAGVSVRSECGECESECGECGECESECGECGECESECGECGEWCVRVDGLG